MEDSDYIQLAASVLHAMGSKARSAEIADYAQSATFRVRRADGRFRDLGTLDKFEITSRLTRAINKHIDQTPPGRQLVTGTKAGGWSLGPLAQKALPTIVEDLKQPTDTVFTGLVGEYAVMSELSACDWNAAKLAHDDGVDLVAVKGPELRTVQVKTAHVSNGAFRFTLKSAAHHAHTHLRHYYVLVMRTMQTDRYVNEFVILGAQRIRVLESAGELDFHGRPQSSVTVKTRDGRVTIGAVDVSDCLNNFRKLFI